MNNSLEHIGRPSSAEIPILVVDDEPMLRAVILEFLDLLGYTFHHVAGNGREALEQLRSRDFMLMLSDIRMPEMELEDVLKFTNSEFPRLTVIATSGYSDFDSARSILSQGAHDFLEKPLNLDSLETALCWAIDRDFILRATAAWLPSSSEETPQESIQRLEKLIDEQVHSFPYHLKHSLRIHRLACQLETALPSKSAMDLALATLIHEMGMSHVLNATCMQTRRIEEYERAFIVSHARAGGKMVGLATGNPRLVNIVANHLDWREIAAEPDLQNDATVLATIWLGILNLIDGLIRPRPDRSSYPLEQIRQSLQRRHESHPHAALELVLNQWPTVEGFYAVQDFDECRS